MAVVHMTLTLSTDHSHEFIEMVKRLQICGSRPFPDIGSPHYMSYSVEEDRDGDS